MSSDSDGSDGSDEDTFTSPAEIGPLLADISELRVSGTRKRAKARYYKALAEDSELNYKALWLRIKQLQERSVSAKEELQKENTELRKQLRKRDTSTHDEQLQQAQAELAKRDEQLQQAQEQFQQARAELMTHDEQLQQAQATLQQAQEQLQQAQEQLQQAQEQLQQERSELVTRDEQLQQARSELDESCNATDATVAPQTARTEAEQLTHARKKMNEAVQLLLGGDASAEENVDKWDQAIRMNPEYKKEQEEQQRQWNEEQEPANKEAVCRMRRLMPRNMAVMSIEKLMKCGLTHECAFRLLSERVLRLIVTHPDTSRKIHIVDLNMYSNQGLDITEMRAVYACLPPEFDLDGDGKKAEWRGNFGRKLNELIRNESTVRGSGLCDAELRHSAYKEAELELKRRAEENAKNGGTAEPYYFDPTLQLECVAVRKSKAFEATEKPDFLNKDSDATPRKAIVTIFTKERGSPDRSPNPLSAMQDEIAKKANARRKRVAEKEAK